MVLIFGKCEVKGITPQLLLGLLAATDCVQNIGGSLNVYTVVDSVPCAVGSHSTGDAADVMLTASDPEDYEEMAAAVQAFLGDNFLLAKITEDAADHRFHLMYAGR
jgi:hypothetical protein